MYNVSDAYKEALQKKDINDRISGTVTLTDGAEIKLSDSNIVRGSLKIVHELCGDYRIGTFNLGCLKIGFFDDSALLRDFSGSKISLSYEIETENGWESVPMGIYIADGASVRRKRNTITLTAYDYGILFDCDISSNIREMSDTAEHIITAVCEWCGVEFGGMEPDLPNTAVLLSPSSQQLQSCRDVIEWCAVLLCGYAVIDREGKLRIISARYYTSAAEELQIVVDKQLKSFERNNIYVTDTRAWISAISAYSGDKRKIYKSTITQNDEQAARAIYTLEKNPLLTGKTEEECDSINGDWLTFVDSFKQRGITAEIYGDPALDAGDVLRCSEGDIDQRRSIVGLITRQEWRYRAFHSIECAAPQLSDGFEEPEENAGAEEGDETTEISAKPQALKVISQLEKKFDGLETSGAELVDGVGTYVNSPDGGATIRVNLLAASASELGGVYLSPGANTGLTATEGRFSFNGVLGLKNANSKQIGGLMLGDGLCPTEIVSETPLLSYGEQEAVVQVRVGDGLEFTDNPVAESGTIEDKRNGYGGRPIGVAAGIGLDFDEEKKLTVKMRDGFFVNPDGSISVQQYTSGKGVLIDHENYEIKLRIGSGLKFNAGWELEATAKPYTAGDGIEIGADSESGDEVISVKLGSGLEFDDNGAIKATTTGGGAVEAGNGIDIGTNPDTEADVISAKLGEGLEFGEGGEINALTNIENAVVISEAQAKYLLHNYTQVEYLSGNRIGYAGPENQVIVQGFIANFGNNTTAAREGTRYTGGKLTTFSGTTVTEKEITVEIFTSTPESTVYRIYINGTQAGSYTTYNPEVMGFVIQWENINGTKSEAAPYGYAYASLYALSEGSTGTIGASAITGLTRINIPFISEAEYNAAVGLTYEPNVLTEVQETVTEV